MSWSTLSFCITCDPPLQNEHHDSFHCIVGVVASSVADTPDASEYHILRHDILP